MEKNSQPNPLSPLRGGWQRYRRWLAGLSRGQRIRYRALQAAAVVAVVIVAAALYLRAWVRLPDVPQPPVVQPPPDVSLDRDTSSALLEYEGAQLPDVTRSGRREGYYTFLVAGRDVVSGATDTMLLFTYDTQNQRINAISLLRDTMVNTSASRGAQKRLNVVFARNLGDRQLPDSQRTANGMAALKQEVSRLTGIYPDFYVLVEWEAIGRLVDAIGGVEFEVPYDMDYDDYTPGQDLHIHQKAGLRLLTGQDAMEVIRFRKNNDESIKLGDIGRTQIQRDFLTAVLKRCLTPEILLKLPTLVQIFVDNVSTDLTIGNILAFAELAVGMDTENDINFVSMPFNNVFYDGASLVVARQSELLELLNDGLNPYVDEIKSSDLQLMYRKSGGGFGVTNAALLDAQVGIPPAPKEEEPEEDQDPPEEDPDQEDPGAGQNPEEQDPGEQNPGEQDPGGTAENPPEQGEGGTQQPPEGQDPGGFAQNELPQSPEGNGSQSGGIVAIDPDTIFPDPASMQSEI